MKKIFILFALCALSIALFSSCSQIANTNKQYTASITNEEVAKPFTDSDLKLLYSAYNLANFHLQIATEALYRSTAQESRQLATNIQQTSKSITEDIEAIANQYELILPHDMSLQQKEDWTNMVKAKGWNFDKKFAEVANDAITVNETFYTKFEKVVKDDALKSIAKKALNNVSEQNNLMIAQQEKVTERTMFLQAVASEETKDLKNKKGNKS